MTTVTANIDDAITRARRQIELLREYRTRLIADVVTGKLDVRETAASLPGGSRSVTPLELDNNDRKCNRMQPDATFSQVFKRSRSYRSVLSRPPSARRQQACRRAQLSGIQ